MSLNTVDGIFSSATDAETALRSIKSSGVDDTQIFLLTPQESVTDLQATTNTTVDPPGACGANSNNVDGSIMGFAGGILSGAATMLLIPGVGPLLAVGTVAVGGALGALVGGTLGEAAVQSSTIDVPQERLFVYEEALRRGFWLLFVRPTDEAQAKEITELFKQARVVDSAIIQEEWWAEQRNREAAAYSDPSVPFDRIEELYRRGFEAALLPQVRDKSATQVSKFLDTWYSTSTHEEAFQRGFERGRLYHEALREQDYQAEETAATHTKA